MLAAKESPIDHIYHVYKTVCEMLYDRGYDVSEDHLTKSLETFKAEHPDGRIEFIISFFLHRFIKILATNT